MSVMLQTRQLQIVMSAFPPNADIAPRDVGVSFANRRHPHRYSITSSASESTLFGIAKFIAFAVFKLMTNR